MTKNLLLPNRDQVWAQMESAFTLKEVEAAEKLVDSYRKRTGDDSITSTGEVLAHSRDYALLRQTQAQQLGLSPRQIAQRESLIRQFHNAQVLDEILTVREACLSWQRQYPSDPLLPECLDLLDSKEQFVRMMAEAEQLLAAA
jgi:hypothetical protein